MNIFDELNQANRAYCLAHGFSTAELYGIEPNQAELDTHKLIQAGVPAESICWDDMNETERQIQELVCDMWSEALIDDTFDDWRDVHIMLGGAIHVASMLNAYRLKTDLESVREFAFYHKLES